MTEEERYVYWKNQIQEQKDSDLSINAFCVLLQRELDSWPISLS